MTAAEILIKLNGAERRVSAGTSVATLLESLDKGRGGVAVELNREVLPRAAFATTSLENGDAVEVVEFVGGG